MARLRKQRRVVKKLDNFFKNVTYSHPSTRGVRLGNISNDAIPEGDFSQHIATTMSTKDYFVRVFRPKYFSSEQYLLHRANQNNRLFKTCLEDGFIEPVTKQVYDQVSNVYTTQHLGIRVSNKGTDLLHFLGFWEEVFKKYPISKLIVYTILGTLLSTAVLGTLILKMI